jgi:hypothetical protein
MVQIQFFQVLHQSAVVVAVKVLQPSPVQVPVLVEDLVAEVVAEILVLALVVQEPPVKVIQAEMVQPIIGMWAAAEVAQEPWVAMLLRQVLAEVLLTHKVAMVV